LAHQEILLPTDFSKRLPTFLIKKLVPKNFVYVKQIEQKKELVREPIETKFFDVCLDFFRLVYEFLNNFLFLLVAGLVRLVLA
jgi:hypothetical protein